MRKFILLLSIAALTGFTQASCRSVNLISSEDSPFTKVPVYHQERTNICYAFAAAQLLDYQLISSGANGRAVHPAWVALNYARSKNRKQLDIGHTRAAIDAIRQNGNCDFAEVSSALRSWSPDVRSEAGIIAAIEREKKENSVTVLTRILSSSCPVSQLRPFAFPAVRSLKYSDLGEGKDFSHAIDELFSEKQRPISVSYCANVWKNPMYSGVERYKNRASRLSKDCRYHESVIVGKKTMAGTCSALVRNTFGDRWNSSNRAWTCVCRDRRSGEVHEDCSELSHPSSAYSIEACWLPMSLLSRNTGVLTFLE